MQIGAHLLSFFFFVVCLPMLLLYYCKCVCVSNWPIPIAITYQQYQEYWEYQEWLFSFVVVLFLSWWLAKRLECHYHMSRYFNRFDDVDSTLLNEPTIKWSDDRIQITARKRVKWQKNKEKITRSWSHLFICLFILFSSLAKCKFHPYYIILYYARLCIT